MFRANRSLHQLWRGNRLKEFKPFNQETERNIMLSWSLAFLVFALIAAILGFAGIAGVAATIGKVLFVLFLVLFLVSLIAGRWRGV